MELAPLYLREKITDRRTYESPLDRLWENVLFYPVTAINCSLDNFAFGRSESREEATFFGKYKDDQCIAHLPQCGENWKPPHAENGKKIRFRHLKTLPSDFYHDIEHGQEAETFFIHLIE